MRQNRFQTQIPSIALAFIESHPEEIPCRRISRTLADFFSDLGENMSECFGKVAVNDPKMTANKDYIRNAHLFQESSYLWM